MKTITFRTANVEDAILLGEWNKQLIEDEGHGNSMTIPELQGRMDQFLRMEYQGVIFSLDGVYVGYALFREQPDRFYLRQLFVARDRRGQGIGQAAMEILKSRFWTNGKRITVCVLVGNPDAIRFYRKCGFADYSLELELFRQSENAIKPAQDRIEISTDKQLLDIDLIHSFLTTSYWAKNIPREVVERSIRNSFCFGVYTQGQQVGFARVMSDHATFAYLVDVFIVPEFQGRGLGKKLIEQILAHPELQGLRRWLLATQDAQELYARFGFTSINNPENYMTVHHPNLYAQ
ncbi:MAG TPA: GNAT family N-acetyltransferase [Pirellula sp.]|nr:GNAT family N-acetyltransferase [Pirellula sp.]